MHATHKNIRAVMLIPVLYTPRKFKAADDATWQRFDNVHMSERDTKILLFVSAGS